MAWEKPRSNRQPIIRFVRDISLGLASILVALATQPVPAQWQASRESVWKEARRSGALAAERLGDDAADGHLEQHRFLSAALIVSGVESAETRRELEQRYDRWFERRAVVLREIKDPVEQARALLHALHRDWLTGQYFAACARVDQTLVEGHFNCVTATVLFHEAARRLGLPDRIIAVPGHVFNQLELPGRTVDVQTTSPTWLDPGAVRPAVPGGTPRELTEVQLVGKLYYNRGVALLAQEQYEASAQLFGLALAWDPQDRSAAQNLLAAFNNGALAAAERRQYATAMKLLKAGMQFDPDFAPLQANYRHVAATWVRRLLATSQPRAARDLLDEVAQMVPDQQWWVASQRRSVARWEALHQTVSTPTATVEEGPWLDEADLTTAAP